MIFDKMKPEFIILLLLFGVLCILFLLSSIRTGFHSNGQMSAKFKAIACFSTSIVFTLFFIKTTAPTKAINNILVLALFSALVLSGLIWTATAFVFIKTKNTYLKPLFFYKDLLDEIDDYVMIFNEKGEAVAQNSPKSKELLFAQPVTSLEDVMEALEIPAFLSMLKEPAEIRITANNRHYLINSSIIRDKKERVSGTVFVFHDVTKEQQLIDELKEKNDQITQMNEQLMQEIEVDEALLDQKERERLATAIQHELDTKLNETICKIDDRIKSNENSRAEKEHSLKTLAEDLRNILEDIRRVVYMKKL